MSDNDQSKKKKPADLTALLSKAFRRLRIGLRNFYRGLPSGIRWTLIVLSSIFLLSAVILFITDLLFTEEKLVPKEIIVKQATIRLHQIADAVSNLRDTVGMDSVWIEQLKSETPPTVLFETKSTSATSLEAFPSITRVRTSISRFVSFIFSETVVWPDSIVGSMSIILFYGMFNEDQVHY